jgi:hypothetical protein
MDIRAVFCLRDPVRRARNGVVAALVVLAGQWTRTLLHAASTARTFRRLGVSHDPQHGVLTAGSSRAAALASEI